MWKEAQYGVKTTYSDTAVKQLSHHTGNYTACKQILSEKCELNDRYWPYPAFFRALRLFGSIKRLISQCSRYLLSSKYMYWQQHEVILYILTTLNMPLCNIYSNKTHQTPPKKTISWLDEQRLSLHYTVNICQDPYWVIITMWFQGKGKKMWLWNWHLSVCLIPSWVAFKTQRPQNRPLVHSGFFFLRSELCSEKLKWYSCTILSIIDTWEL